MEENRPLLFYVVEADIASPPISESGFYRFTMRSDKPEAKEFQNWVAQEVLPAIRKPGSYRMLAGSDVPARADYLFKLDETVAKLGVEEEGIDIAMADHATKRDAITNRIAKRSR